LLHHYLVKPAVAIIVGGKTKGSNMAALIKASKSGQLEAEVSVVIGPKEDAPALDLARSLGIPTNVVEPGGDYLAALANVDCICLAGFLRLLPDNVLKAFSNRILNIHPALLPKFGGKGMYGMHVHRAVIQAGETESGCTVHLVTEVYDEGPILAQLKCQIQPDDSPEDLAARVLALEHQLYPQALGQFLTQFQQ